MKKYNISDMTQFPDISRFDPVSQAIGLRPDQLCEITRSSKTAIESKYYRVCI
jgi:DNA-directed RNA polymerase subunit H (RpoH/RPB5)